MSYYMSMEKENQMNDINGRAIAECILKANLNYEDVNVIIAAIKAKRSSLIPLVRAKFRVGQVVNFRNRAGRKVVGQVRKVMQKNVQVAVDGGPDNGNWRVNALQLEVGA